MLKEKMQQVSPTYQRDDNTIIRAPTSGILVSPSANLFSNGRAMCCFFVGVLHFTWSTDILEDDIKAVSGRCKEVFP